MAYVGLSYVGLSYVDLSYVDLSYVDLSYVDLLPPRKAEQARVGVAGGAHQQNGTP